MIKNIVVLAAGPNGLGVLRSLYLKGIRVTCVTRSESDISNFSRLPKQKHILTNSNNEQQQVELKALLLACPAGSIVLPTSDWFVSFLSHNSAELSERLKFILPSEQTVDILIDKAMETQIVGNILPIPKTEQTLSNSEQLKAKLGLPIIIKPRSHEHMVLGKKNITLTTDAELDDFFKQYGNVLEHLIAQEIIIGPDSEQWVCNCVFDKNSNLVQAFTFNRLSLSPAHYGVTSYARSKYNKEIIQHTEKLGKHLNYVGPAMVEFKRDGRDNLYKYIELNPRLGMCNFFDTSCGINNAYATCEVIAGINSATKPQMLNDVMFLSFYEDCYAKRKDGQTLRTIFSTYLKNVPARHVFIFFVWWDPYPALRLSLLQLFALFRSLHRKLTRRH